MREDTSSKNVFITLEELKNLSTIPTNRCGELSLQSALDKGYTEQQYNAFVKRTRKIATKLRKEGYKNACRIIIAKAKEDGKYYILDGQGRRHAVISLVKEGAMSSSIEIPCEVYTKELSYDEITDAIRVINSGNNNWLIKDKIRAEAVHNGGDVLDFYNEIQNFRAMFDKEDYYISDYMTYFVFLGEKYSHANKDAYSNFTKKDCQAFYEIHRDAYASFICRANTMMENGDIVKRSKKVSKLIGNQYFGIAISQCINTIISNNVTKYDTSDEVRKVSTLEVNELIDKLVEKIESYGDGSLERALNEAKTFNGKFNRESVIKFLGLRSNGSLYKKVA